VAYFLVHPVQYTIVEKNSKPHAQNIITYFHINYQLHVKSNIIPRKNGTTRQT